MWVRFMAALEAQLQQSYLTSGPEEELKYVHLHFALVENIGLLSPVVSTVRQQRKRQKQGKIENEESFSEPDAGL